jgi:nickel-dependent lactate racemase
VDDALELLPPSTGGLVVLVNDPQRHTATNAVLRLVADRIAPARLRVLVAAGSHPAPPPAARRAFEKSLLGDIIPAEVQWHECRAADLAPIGRADLGPINPASPAAPDRAVWRGHPWLLEPAGVLAIGSVEPHYFAGWTGAHKTATVGVAAHDDIQANHALALSPRCRPTCLDGNPVAEGILAMLAALEAARPVAAVNLVQAGPDILAAAGGSVRAALDAALPPAEAAFVRRIDKPADALIAEVAGPLAASFYQADKGIKNNDWAVRVYVVSEGLSPADAALLGLRKAPTVAAALADAGIRPGRHSVLHVQDAGNLAVMPSYGRDQSGLPQSHRVTEQH